MIQSDERSYNGSPNDDYTEARVEEEKVSEIAHENIQIETVQRKTQQL